MGMNFSPMYQPVSTKTIKADGDLNVSPYDVIGYDGKFDTVEADEFVGGVGNFTSLTQVETSKFMYNGVLNTSGNIVIVPSTDIAKTVTRPVHNTVYTIGTININPQYGLIDVSNAVLPDCYTTVTATMTGESGNVPFKVYKDGVEIVSNTISTSIGTISVQIPFSFNVNGTYTFKVTSGDYTINTQLTIKIMTPALYA